MRERENTKYIKIKNRKKERENKRKGKILKIKKEEKRELRCIPIHRSE